MLNWFIKLPDPVKAATVSAVTLVLTLVIKEMFDRARDRRTRSKDSLLVYQRYADPLLVVATQLLWRLNEILDEGRCEYLVGSSARPAFELYKVRSTLYRLAAVLGWLRAIDRELFMLRLPDPKAVAKVEGAILDLRRSLSDGTRVEHSRVLSLCDAWQLSPPQGNELKRVGSELDALIKKELHGEGCSLADQLSEAKQASLYVAMRDRLRAGPDGLGGGPARTSAVADAMTRVSIRQAWIYFDWQAAIGDVMIVNSSFGERKYEVVGYRDFERLIVEGPNSDRIWMERLLQVIDDLDVTESGARDARAAQLSALYTSIATLIDALQAVKGSEVYLNAATRAKVQSVINRAPPSG